MKRDTLNYSQIGIFVIAALTILFYALARIGGDTGKHDRYYTAFHNITGVKEGTTVTFEGYEVGHVEKILPETSEKGMHYRLALAMKPGWRIPVDSVASISMSGVLSGQVVEVRGGKNAQALAPGGEIRGSDAPSLLAAVGALASQWDELTRTKVAPAVDNIHLLSGLLKQNGTQTFEQLNGALAHLNTAASGLETVLDHENRQHVRTILKNADHASNDFEQTQAKIQYTLQQTQSILSNLDQASRRINELSRRLSENPSAILTSRPPAETSEAAQ